MIINQYNQKVEKLSEILKRGEFDMVRSLTVLWITVKNSIDTKYVPKNVSLNNCYCVVAEKTVKYTNKDGKENEELSFGIINDIHELVYIASYNCKVSTRMETISDNPTM